MAYRRIHDSIATSPSVARLSLLAHLAWPHLAYVADNFGRGLARSRSVHHAMFQLRDDVTEDQVAGWMDEWEAHGMIVRYQVEGILYFQIVNFAIYQPDTTKNRRRVESRFPAAPSMLQACSKHAPSMPQACHKHAAAIQRTENKEQRAEGRAREQSRSSAPSPPPPRLSQVPPEIRSRAEQHLGRLLAPRDEKTLVSWCFTSRFTTAEIIAAFDEPRAVGKGLDYLTPIVTDFHANGVPQPLVVSARGHPRAPDPSPPPTRARYPTAT